MVDPLFAVLKIFHAIRGGSADLDRQLQQLDALLISASQPPDDMDIGPEIMRIGQHQESNDRRNAVRHKRITELLPRSVAEFYAVYAYTDVSAAKMNTFLSLTSCPQFNPHDLAEFTCVQTMESRIMSTIFPGGHRTKDLTRIKDQKKLVLHYIPYVEASKRMLRNKMLAGHIYTKYEVQMSPRNPANREMGRANSGTWFQAAQIRAQRLVLKAGKGCDVRVAGLLTASDATYGLKNMPWHGMYGKALICKLIGLMIKH
jgi:hypothetical protein